MIRKEREKLYANIIEKHKKGLKPVEIAKLYDITRQRVYQVLEVYKKNIGKKFDKRK